jgi:hypothetical protein
LIDECDIDARQSLAVLEEDLERKWKLYKSSDLTLKLWIMSEKKRKKEAEKSSKKANFKARVPSSNTTLLVCSHTSLSFFFLFFISFRWRSTSARPAGISPRTTSCAIYLLIYSSLSALSSSYFLVI